VHLTGGTRRVFREFSWLKAGFVKMALSRPAHQRVTRALGWLVSKKHYENIVPSDINDRPGY